MSPDAPAKVVKDEKTEKKVRFKVQLFQIRTSDEQSSAVRQTGEDVITACGQEAEATAQKLRRAARV